MALTRDTNGLLRVLAEPEPPHVALLHQLVRDSHNAGERGVDVRRLRRTIRSALAQTTHEHLLGSLRALEGEGLLAEEEGSEGQFFLHTSTAGFRLEFASTAYRQAVSDLHLQAEGELHELLEYADRVMRAVKAAGKDPSRARKLLEPFTS